MARRVGQLVGRGRRTWLVRVFIRAAVALNLKGKSKPKPRRVSSKRGD